MNERCGVREKNFSEELPYFKERLNKVLDEHYDSNGGGEDPLHICVLRDSNRIVRKAEAEIERLTTLCTKQNEELDRLQKVRANILKVMKENISQTKSEAIKEFAERLRTNVNKDLRLYGNCTVFDLVKHIENLVKEMTEVKE